MTKELKAELSLLAVTVVWGASFPIMSIALKYIQPYSLIALRYFIAALLLGIIINKKIMTADKKTIEAGILIGISLFLGCTLQVMGLKFTTPSKSGFITGLNVVFVPLFLAVIYKKLPDVKTILGVILSVAGLGIMSINGSTFINKGDLMTLFSAVAFAIQIILVDRLVKQDMNVLVLSFIQFFTVGVLSVMPAAVFENFNIEINLSSVSAIIFLSVFCTIIAYYVQNKMQPLTNPVHAAVIFLAEPVFAALFSLLIGDKLTGKTFIGCLLILAGMVIINIKKGEFN